MNYLTTQAAPDGFMYFIMFWVFVLIAFMSIGGYFMFRKFIKVLPKEDGKSKLDWQNHYVEASRHLWTDESKQFLEMLVEPVPSPFRDIARHTIAAKIGEVALADNASVVTRDHCIRGYILATPRRDYKSLTSYLDKKQIDYAPYKHLLQ
ncbi:DUF2621 domain-containing protein [Paenibacillus mucilaginosus]|uniref:YneK n=1 Tax=Paenibacillus mucilaginosus (strain KNP414) TaxID=1036673 RepID=F8FQS5_PAEMK|nr:DUF2621 domain-containing protein [Paenibacillus mucilaginosus]AEI39255.1 YneK [Paenibacillus mucilaginosus KNP414]MCG7217103.1 DUF2621 domain-containing protein [Paenibacillus mucilaginosus]WDM28262.1 DUF2621 domain-containing protein [Paenibacillus mucilaginosus]